MGGGYLGTLAVKLTAEIDQLRQRLAQGENLTKAFSAATVAAFLAVGAAAFAAGLAIDDALDNIRISTGATGGALAGLEGSFNRVFASVPSSAGDASSAVAQLSVRTGATGVALENLSTQVLTLSRITKSDLNTTVEDSAKVFQGWGIAASEQAGTLDMVLRASQATGVQVSSLLQTMVTAGPVFRAAGYDFATSAALIGGFEKAGVNGQRAVASLTAAFRYFGKEGKKLGVDAKTGIAQTIARIQELGPGAASAALGIKVFGRSAVDMVAAIHSGRLNVDELVETIANGSETIASAAKATDGFTETLQILRNNAVLALEPFGTAILSAFNAALLGVLSPSKALIGTLNVIAQTAIALSIAVGTRMVLAFISAARAMFGTVLASRAQLLANVENTAAALAAARASVVQAEAQLVTARAMGNTTAGILAQDVSLVGLAGANAAAAAAETVHAGALSALTWRARAATASMTVLKGVLAFFGGPIGLAITAVLAIVSFAFYNTGKKAREAAAEARKAAEDFRAAIATMDDATFAAAATVTRQNYRRTREMIAQQQESITRAEAVLEQSRNADGAASRFGEGKGLSPLASAATRAAEAQLRREQDNLTTLTQSQRIYAENVRTVREQEAALARQRTTTTTPPPPTGALPWEGDSDKGKRYAEQLRERVGLLMQVAEAQREQGISAASVMGELNRLYRDAAANLSGLGEAGSLSPELLGDYRDFLGVVQQISATGALGLAGVGEQFQQRLLVGVHAAKTAVENQLLPSLRFAADAFVSRMKSIKGESLVGVLREVPFADRLDRLTATIGTNLKEGAATAAQRLTEASERVRGMWGSLLSALPEQIANFASMFSAIKERREAQSAAGEPVTGLAPFPGAVAFMLAAEAMAPVLEALRVPMAALMVPVQLLAQAFGPLLGSLLKAFFPIFKQFGIAVSYVAQVAGYVGGALFKVIGEIIRTVGSLIAKIPGLGEEGKALKDFGKGLVNSSKEMFELARSMPGVREELKNLTWEEAMKRASESADRLSESLSNVPQIFDLVARRAQVLRGDGPQAAASVSSSSAVVSMNVAASVTSAAAGAGTAAAKAITSESALWKAALVEGAQLASKTLAGAATGLRGVLAGIMAEMPRQARALSGGAVRPADLSSLAPSPSPQRAGTTQQVHVSVTVESGAFPILGSVKGEVEAQIRDLPDRLAKHLADELNRPGTSRLKAAVRGVATATVY